MADITTTDDEAVTPREPVPRSGEGWWLQRLVLSFVRFLREIVAELRKVIWPSRHELITYTTVVVVFVVVLVAIVSGLDFGFARLTLWAFG